MTKNFVNTGDTVYAVINLKLEKFRCYPNVFGDREKHLTLGPLKAGTWSEIKYLGEFYQINGLEDYVFKSWMRAKKYQLKQIAQLLRNIFTTE